MAFSGEEGATDLHGHPLGQPNFFISRARPCVVSSELICDAL